MIHHWVWRMSRLARDRKAKPVSRGEFFSQGRGQGKSISPVQLTTSRIGNQARLVYTRIAISDNYAPSSPEWSCR